MNIRKDLTQEAQLIIDNYIKKRQLEQITAEYLMLLSSSTLKNKNQGVEYIKSDKLKFNKAKIKRILNILLIASIIIFINSLIYLILFLNFQ